MRPARRWRQNHHALTRRHQFSSYHQEQIIAGTHRPTDQTRPTSSQQALPASRLYRAERMSFIRQGAHPHEVEAWRGACEAQSLLTGTDPSDALDNRRGLGMYANHDLNCPAGLCLRQGGPRGRRPVAHTRQIRTSFIPPKLRTSYKLAAHRGDGGGSGCTDTSEDTDASMDEDTATVRPRSR